MDLNRDAMLVNLHIQQWSGRRYDRKASNQVAIDHDALTTAGRYNKLLLPAAAFGPLISTVSATRSAHYANTLPWDDEGSRLLTVANYDNYTARIDRLIEQMVIQRNAFCEEYVHNMQRARFELGRLFNESDYPDTDTVRRKFGISYKIKPIPASSHFIAALNEEDNHRIRRDIERQLESQLHDAMGDLYRRLGDAVERVRDRLGHDNDGKPNVFRDSLIGNIRDLVETVPRLNIFGDDRLAALCQEVKDRIGDVDPALLRPQAGVEGPTRDRVRQDAARLAEQFAGYFSTPDGNQQAA